MRRTKSLRSLCLEFLEDRCCPTLVEQYIGGSLIPSGSPTATQGQSLSITRVPGAPLALHVRDGNVATSGVDSVTEGSTNPARVGKDLQVSDFGSTAQALSVLALANSTVGGNVSITGTDTNGAGGGGDFVDFVPGTVVAGNLTAN